MRMPRFPVDPFIVALLAVVGIATVLPARGGFADVLSVATKVAIALLFALYGVRLSPTEAWHGLRHWRLHTLVLSMTFIAFPLLGLAAHALVPAVLTAELYTGLLFLCLVPSTVQSSIAFTSIAHGNVPAAIVSASLSNMLGVVLTPLLVVLLMHTSGAPRVDGSAVLDIVLQLLAPFIVGQLLRPWAAGWVHRHPLVTKVFDHGSILLVVYTAFSISMAEHILSSVSPWRVVAVAVVGAALLAVMLGITVGTARTARLNRADAAVLLLCGSKKSLASGLPMALVLFGNATAGLIMLPLMIFHQIQLIVAPSSRPGCRGAGRNLVPADVDRVGCQQRQRQRLTAQDPPPQIHPGLNENVGRQRRQHNPVVALDLTLQLADRPARVAGEDAHAFHHRRDRLGLGVEVHHHHPALHVPEPLHPVRVGADPQGRQAQGGVAFHRPADEHRLGLGGQLGPLRQHVVHRGLARPVQHHPERPAVVVLDDVDDAAPKGRLEQIGVGQQQSPGPHPVRRRGDVILRII